MKITTIAKSAEGAQQATDAPLGFHMILPITKVDKEKRIVEGVATGEWKDHHGEIVDYAAAKTAFEAWPGNIREMHQPIAAGRAVGIEFNDEQKSITVRSYISKGAQSTWEKVEDGTLRCYSIGGDGVRKLEKREGNDMSPVIYLSKMGELSLVDEGALPGSEIAIVKMADGELQMQLPADEPVQKVAIVGGPSIREALLAVLKGNKPELAALVQDEAIVKLGGPAVVAITKYMETYDLYAAMAAIQWLQELIASEYYDAAYPVDDADAAANRAQLDVLRSAVKLVMAFMVSEFDQQFAAMERAEATDAVTMFKAAALSAPVQTALAEMPLTFSALDTTGRMVFIGKAGARHSKADVTMIQAMHDTSKSLGAVCEAVEKMIDVDEPAVVKFLEAVPVDQVPEGIKAVVAKLAVPAAPIVAPVPEPAAPVAKAADGSEIPPVAKSDTPVVTDTAAVQKMIDNALKSTVEKVAGLESTIAEQKVTIEKQTSDLAAFKAQPVPGGPVKSVAPGSVVVDKDLGNHAPTADLTPEQTIAGLTELAKVATTDRERQTIAELVVKVQHASGLGATPVRFAPSA